MSPSSTVIARPPVPSASRTAGAPASAVNTHGLRLMPARIAQTRGSSPLSTTQPCGRVTLVTMALTSASWSTVSMPCMPEVVGRDVGDDRDVVVR